MIGRLFQADMPASFIQFAKFCIVGASNTAVSYFLNIGILLVLSSAEWRWDYIFANVMDISFYCSNNNLSSRSV